MFCFFFFFVFSVQEQETIKVLNQMKETVDKQRDELRRKDADVRSKMEEIEAVSLIMIQITQENYATN